MDRRRWASDHRRHAEGFSTKRIHSLAVDSDESLIAYRSGGETGKEPYSVLARYSQNGDRLALWPKEMGLWEKLKGMIASGQDAGHFCDIRDRVAAILNPDVAVSTGRDGHCYLLCSEWIARYDRSGKLAYLVKLPCDYTSGRVCADVQGNAFVIGRGDGQAALFRVSPTGCVETLVPHVSKGGTFGSETELALGPDGTLFALGEGALFRVFSGDGRLRCMSDRSREEDAEVREEERRDRE